MKKLFLTLVTLISFTSVFADTWTIKFTTEVVSASPSFPVTTSSFESICNVTNVTDSKNVTQLLSEQEIEEGTYVKAHFAFTEQDEYTLVGIYCDDGGFEPEPVTVSYLNNFHFTANCSMTFIVKVAVNNYYYKEAGTFVSQYDGTPSGDGLYELDGISGNKVYGKLATEIVAGKPYIALPGNHSVILKAQANPVVDFTGKEYNGFYASDNDATTVTGKDRLIFYGGSLCYPNANGNTVPVGRAYIKIEEAKKAYEESATSNKSKAIMSFDDGTGIDNITLGDDSNNGPAYTISGQRVSNPTKGLYIINGKKVLMK